LVVHDEAAPPPPRCNRAQHAYAGHSAAFYSASPVGSWPPDVAGDPARARGLCLRLPVRDAVARGLIIFVAVCTGLFFVMRYLCRHHPLVAVFLIAFMRGFFGRR
jgi:hypothetical protein